MLAEVTAEKLATGDVCAVATDRYHRIFLWQQLFTALIFLAAVFLLVMAALAVIFATNKEWAETIAAAVAALATGKPLAWVLARQKEAKAEAGKAWTELKAACSNVADPAPGDTPALVQSMKFKPLL